MIDTETAYMIIIGLLAIHLFFFLGFQYQLLQILDELAFPSDDPIMTSTLEEPNSPDIFEYEENTTVLEEEPEVFEYAEPKDIEQWDNEQPEVLEEPEEVLEVPEEVSKPTTSVLYEVGDYTESGEATLRQIKGMRKDDVIGICEIHGLDTEGTKAQLIERIKQNA